MPRIYRKLTFNGPNGRESMRVKYRLKDVPRDGTCGYRSLARSLLINSPLYYERMLQNDKSNKIREAIKTCAAQPTPEGTFEQEHCLPLRKIMNTELKRLGEDDTIPIPSKSSGVQKKHWLGTYQISAFSNLTCTPIAITEDVMDSVQMVVPTRKNSNCKPDQNKKQLLSTLAGKIGIYYEPNHFRPLEFRKFKDLEINLT